MHQRWEALLFLHWRLPAARIQETLPRGLTVDTFDGETYLGLSPFFMRDVRPVGLPAVPWLSHFQELNVRTYVFDEHGVPGIWFYSLDCDQPLAVAGARALTGLPYFNATMSAERGEFIEYSCQRDGAEDVARYRYRGFGADQPTRPESFEFFVLERYYLFSMRGDSLVRGQVSHQPYQYRGADTQQVSAAPARWDGFIDLTDKPMHACFVAGFEVKIYATQTVD